MRLASKYSIGTNQIKTKPFLVKKDRKVGLVVSSPSINWKELTESEAKVQWVVSMNYLWELEKHGSISRSDFTENFNKLVKGLGYNTSQLQYLKDWEIPLTLLFTAFMIKSGALYKPAGNYLVKNIKKIIERSESKKKAATVVKQNIKDSPESILINEIMGYEDNIFKEKINFSEWVVQKKLTEEQALKIKKFYIPRTLEINLIKEGKDEQLNYAYRKYTKPQIQYMLNWYVGLIKALASVENTVVTIVRKERVKTPDQIVKKVKYLKSHEELDIKSINPQKIIGSSTLCMYNTKTRKLVVYYSKEGYTLSVEGTTLVNYDEKKSSSKTLRKPDIQLKEFLNRGKKPMLEYFTKIKSVDSSVSGRINGDMVLLIAF